MQNAGFPCLILVGLLAVANLLQVTISGARVQHEPRWPTAATLYAVDSWSVQPPTVQYINNAQYVSRNYSRPDASTATLILVTSPEAKNIYRAGGDLPFLGQGYTVEAASTQVVPAQPGRDALIVRSGNDSGLVLYAYGERRGLLGNGVLGWSMVAFDAGLGHRNDYFRVFLLAPLRGVNPADVSALVTLADTLFLRLASWYGA
jgi:hypothetical protein